MLAIDQNEIFELAADLLSYIERSEAQLDTIIKKAANQRSDMLSRHHADIARLDSTYSQRQSQIKSGTSRIVKESQAILADVENLDRRLEEVDKYYVKTKKRKEEELASRRDSLYDRSKDAFETLRELKTSYELLVDKYANDILPSLINGLNYLFSSKRKKDYENLIVLRNTVRAFIDEIGSTIPELQDEAIGELNEKGVKERSQLLDRQREELEGLNRHAVEQYDRTMDTLAKELDNLFPDDLIEYFVDLETQYRCCMDRVNTSSSVTNGVLHIGDLVIPFGSLCAMVQTKELLSRKLSRLSDGECAFLPLPMSLGSSPNWFIRQEGIAEAAAEEFVHSIMNSFLANVPIPSLEFLVVDPENRGNSIAPWFDARKSLPELFGDAINITKDQVDVLIGQLNEYIEDVLQDKLGNQYGSISEYAAENERYTPKIRLLVIFDFPRAFDERSILSLRNILRNGRRAGVYTVITQEGASDIHRSDVMERMVQSITSLSTVAVQHESFLTVRGLPLVYVPMPDKSRFSSYFGRYMLVYEGIKNKGIAYSPLVRRLVESKDDGEAKAWIDELKRIDNVFLEAYGKSPDVNATFRTLFPIGQTSYPANLFVDSSGFNAIRDEYCLRCDEELGVTGSVRVPFAFDLTSGFGLFLTADDTSWSRMIELSHHVIWDFLSNVPATKAEICILDNERRGNSVVPFLELKKSVPEAFGEGICAGQDAMLARLREINERIDDLTQNKLSNKYDNILEYNSSSPSRAEKLMLLVLYDFPSGMDTRSLGFLHSILQNGGKCGVSVLFCFNPNVTYSKYDETEARIQEVRKLCTVISCRDGKYRVDPFGLALTIPDLPDFDRINFFTSEYASVCAEIKKKGLSFKDIIDTDHFTGDSSSCLSIPIGIGDGDSIVSLTVGKGSSHHGLITGATGSGKSTLMHTLIMSAMLKYAPNQLHLYLMDFKGGTEFKVYETVKLPHIQLLALDAMQEFGESILENLVTEMERRSRLFKAAGQTSLKDFVKETGEALPRILVLMDEFQILFNDATNRKVANNCAELTKRIVTEGRSFGIHLLMATQSTKVIGDLTLSRGTIEQMRIRIGMKCGEDDARYLFSDRNDREALRMMIGPIGTAVMNPEYMESDNIGFRVAYCDDETQKMYLKEIEEKYASVPSSLQIFEGGRVTSLSELTRTSKLCLTDELPVRVHLGELIKVAPPLEISLDRRHRHNLLVCGSNERMAKNIIDLYVVTALMNRNTTVLCIDGDQLMGDSSSSELYAVLKKHFGDRFDIATSDDDMFRLLNRAYENYVTNKASSSVSQTILIIKDMQFLENVKKMLKGERVDEPMEVDALNEPEEEVANNPLDPFASINSYFASKERAASRRFASADRVGPTEKIQALIDGGSANGVHVVVSSLDYQSVGECMRYGERVLAKFPERIMFSISENDAYNLIEGVSVSSLRDNTVYFTDGIKSTLQLKPYSMPDASEVDSLLDTMNGRG